MYCKSCGTKLETTDKFCKNCGDKTEFLTKNEKKNGLYKNISSENDDLSGIYISKNNEKIKKGKFSFPTLFFGPLYLLYRKIWLVGFIWIVALIISLIVIPTYTIIIYLVFSIVSAMVFNQFYLNSVDKKVEKIKKENLDRTSEEIVQIVKRKGGVSIVSIIVIIFFFIGITTVSGLFLLFNTITKGISSELKDSVQKYDDGLEYVISDGFETGSISNFYKRYSYYGENSSCSATIKNTTSGYYASIEEYLKYNVYTRGTDISSEIDAKVINDKEWYFQVVKTTYAYKYYYATENNGTMYLVEFDINKDQDNFCSNSLQSFINSLNFKDNTISGNSV